MTKGARIATPSTRRSLRATSSSRVTPSRPRRIRRRIPSDTTRTFCSARLTEVRLLIVPLVVSLLEKILQVVGSWTLRLLSQTCVRDAASGFRAYSRETCLRLFLCSRFSHCMETLIQAGNSGMRVGSVDVQINAQTRPSRLFRSIPEYVLRSGATILNMFLLYRPLELFLSLSILLFASAGALALRFIYFIYFLNINMTVMY